MRRGSGHPDAVIAPVDVDLTAVEVDLDRPPGETTAISCYVDGLGGRSGCQRDTHAAFPDAHS